MIQSLKNLWEEIDLWVYINLKPIYDFFRYDIHNGIRNFWNFKKEIWNYRPWDYHYNIMLFSKSIDLSSKSIDKYGSQTDETKLPMITQMNRFVWLANNYNDGISLAEVELGPIEYNVPIEDMIVDDVGQLRYMFTPDPHRTKVFKRSDELENAMWDEMWNIIKGNDEDSTSLVDFDVNKPYIYSGNNLKTWWD